jgi:hypothetical protein
MEDMLDWFELHYDADELVDVLQIEVEELVEAFPERCRNYMEGHPDV